MGGTAITAKVESESVGGVTLRSARDAGIAEGESVHVVCEGIAMPAVVRHVEPHANGRIFIGLEWVTADLA